MKMVQENGIEKNTLFIFTSEQGSMFPHGKWTCYDIGTHVEFIARWPGHIKPGSVTEAMVQYVDVVPTLIEAAGGEPIKGLDGRSFLPVLLGKTDKHNDFVYGVHTTNGIASGSKCYPVRSIRTKTHKLILNLMPDAVFKNMLIRKDRENFWKSWVKKAKTNPEAARLVNMYQKRPAVELYDLRKDMYELNNIAEDPANRKLIAGLRRHLEDWMKQQGDLGIKTETMKKNKKRQKRKG